LEEGRLDAASGERASEVTSDTMNPGQSAIGFMAVGSRTPVISAVAAATAAKIPSLPKRSGTWRLASVPLNAVLRVLLPIWLIISVALGIGQSIRIVRFRHRLRWARDTPDGLVEEAERLGQRLRVAVPELLVVPGLRTPLLWCLGRPRLVLPEKLVETLAIKQWRGILIHELAHLRRRDHWISWLELLAGLVWWWNPVYWVTRRRLDAEAELACDAWVVWALPKDRLSYAEVLFTICTSSLARPLAPTLGIAGSGRFFERRLTMILHEHVAYRLSPIGLIGACLLVLFALPSWSAARPVSFEQQGDLTVAPIAPTAGQGQAASAYGDVGAGDKAVVNRRRPDDIDDDVDDDNGDDDDCDNAADDDDDNGKHAACSKGKAKAETKVKGKAKKPEKAKKSRRDIDVNVSQLEKEIERKFGPGSEFEKRIEEVGEKIGKEIEAKFGPDFEKKMEKLGKEIEAKFGPDFEKKMEKLGKEIEMKLGAGSAFGKRMEELGKEMEAKFGPGSDFDKKIKESASGVVSKAPTVRSRNPLSSNAQVDGGSAKARRPADVRKRERRIRELEAQVRKLVDEIKTLRAAGSQGNDEE
jgi:beta-lactamase regulating signal transducer with metallopeptidase domain